MRVFLDTNVIMDTILSWRPSSEASSKIVNRAFINEFRISVSALSLADVVYSCRKHCARENILSRIDYFQKQWRILELSSFNVYEALHSNCPDFEDALQISIAESDCDVIVTNNIKDFKGYTALEVCTPQEFLDRISAD